MLRWLGVAVLVVGGLSVGGCDGGEPPVVDAGSDAGPPPVDAGPPLACSSTTVLEARVDAPVSVTLDTSMTETRPRDLGLDCGNPESELRWAPQEVVELRIPEDAGDVTVLLDTVFDETLFYFNTVIQVRRACEAVPEGRFPPSCFDDVEGGVLSQGTFQAEGGDVFYLIVTGYSDPPDPATVDRGTVRLDVALQPNAPPTLDDTAVRYAVDDVAIYAEGADANGNAAGVALAFLDAAGDVLDIYGDGVGSEASDTFVVPFAPPPTTTTFAISTRVVATRTNLGPVLRNLGAARARVRLFDRGFALSDAVEVDLADGPLARLGESCGPDAACHPEMTCLGGTCGASGQVAVACANPVALNVPAPVDTATTVTRRSNTGAGVGLFSASRACVPGGSIGQERIYTVEVPDGVTADLLLTTDLSGTGTANTVIYVREDCADAGSELGCNDDRAPGDRQSELELLDLGAGTYWVFVEFLPGVASGAVPHELRATLRPVLASGAACDPAEVDNRCAAGACDAGVCP